MVILYVLGYLWSGLTTVPGLLLFLIAKMLGMVTSTTTYGPALVVQIRGRWADWMQTPNKSGYTFYGHTVGPVIFGYQWLDEKQLTHESVHVRQQMIFGPCHILIYVWSYLLGLVRYRSSFLAYRNCVLERHARRIAGEED